MKSEVLNLYKRKSETPLQTIERYVEAHPEYKGVKMTYAGRLDPMAEGVLVVLVGEANKDREAYTGLDKDYEFEFILGVETDTFDVLGKIMAMKADAPAGAPAGATPSAEVAVKSALAKYLGTFEQRYPSFSSKVVDGTPLFELARRGDLSEKDIPTHKVTVSAIELVSTRTVAKDVFVEMIHKDISAVRGDFRQKDILSLWNKYLSGEAHGVPMPAAFVLYKARVSCGSGFYVRQLVSDLGHDLGTGAVTVSILRTRVGKYRLADSIQ
ncbi:MAG: hypothetical protein KGI79_02395 [Patescibacteria group bacterium]|nr:hypothetical protein [Patescibacteria group bacterium]MDE2116702.1 hypothetical protein [Patescibacteria group bacterium]